MPKPFNRGIIVSADDDGVQVRDVTGLLNPVYPQVNRRTATVTAKTTDYTILPAELNRVFSNTGASGTAVLTLPSVKGAKGKALTLHVLAAQILRALPVTGEAVNLNGSAVVTKYLNIAAVIGNYVDLYCDGVQWIVTGYAGTVTKEA
jgi:hypothetical protein